MPDTDAKPPVLGSARAREHLPEKLQEKAREEGVRKYMTCCALYECRYICTVPGAACHEKVATPQRRRMHTVPQLSPSNHKTAHGIRGELLEKLWKAS